MIDDTCKYCSKDSIHTTLMKNHDGSYSFVCYKCMEQHEQDQEILSQKLRIGNTNQIDALKRQRGEY